MPELQPEIRRDDWKEEERREGKEKGEKRGEEERKRGANGIKLRVLCLQGPYHLSHNPQFIFQIGPCAFAGASLRSQYSYPCLLSNWDFRCEPPHLVLDMILK
jgi:hypothetical protein